MTDAPKRDAGSILKRVYDLVTGPRAATHGNKLQNHQNIADHWNAYLKGRLKTPLTALDAALMMAELKIARTKAGAYNPDDYDDLVGYGSVAGEIAALMTWVK